MQRREPLDANTGRGILWSFCKSGLHRIVLDGEASIRKNSASFPHLMIVGSLLSEGFSRTTRELVGLACCGALATSTSGPDWLWVGPTGARGWPSLRKHLSCSALFVLLFGLSGQPVARCPVGEGISDRGGLHPVGGASKRRLLHQRFVLAAPGKKPATRHANSRDRNLRLLDRDEVVGNVALQYCSLGAVDSQTASRKSPRCKHDCVQHIVHLFVTEQRYGSAVAMNIVRSFIRWLYNNRWTDTPRTHPRRG